MTRFASRLLAALSFVLLAAAPAVAQNYNIANHAIPLGRGTNVSAFNAIAPAANTKFIVGGGTGADFVAATMSGDCSLVAGVVTCAKANGVTMPASGTSGGIPYYSSTSAVSSSALLTQNAIVLGGGAGLAPSVMGSLGTTTTLLHGNASGAPTFGAVVSGDLNITGTTCTNQFVSAISSAAAGTCTTDTLAGAQHANQGTTTTVLHGNASGNPSWGSVAIGSDVSGLGTGIATALSVNTGSAGAPVLFNGAGGTPSSITLTNGTALPVSGITASTSTALGVGSIELGHATDTTVARVSSGRISVEGINVPTISSTDTFTNKSLTSPVVTGTADVQQALLLSGDISPTQIVANTNDYAPTGFSTATTLRLSTDASRNITGLAGGAGGRVIVIHNVGAQNIVLTNQDAASTAANRFLFGGDFTLAADSSVALKYDATSSRWRMVVSPGAGGGGGGGVSSVTVAAGTGISTSGTCTITTSGTCTVFEADQYRQNDLLMCANQAKALAAYQRILETFCDGYKASDGVNSGSSSNYAVTTGSGYVGPTTSAGTTRFPTNMTAASSPSPYVASANAHFGTQDAYLVFDGNASTYWQDASVAGTDTLKIDLGSGNAVSVASYALTSLTSQGGVMIKTWTFEGSNDNSSWTTLDTQASQTAWGSAETRTFTLSSTSAAYRYFRLQITAGNTAGNYAIGTWQATGPITSNNMTLITTTQTADATVSNGRVLMEIDPIDSITLNTDLTAEVTCDSASHWASATLSSAGKGQAGRTVVESADTSCGANTGTGFAARIKNLNNKSVNVYKTTLTVH